MLSIPVSFVPASVAECQGVVEVASVDRPGLVWRYPLRGCPEVHGGQHVLSMSCRAKRRAVQTIDLMPEDLDPASVGPGERFELELGGRDTAGILDIAPVHDSLPGPLRFELTFHPRRAMDEVVALVLVLGHRRWRYELQLHADPPDHDGVLSLEAEVGRTAVMRVPITLASEAEPLRQFRAFFSPDSSLDLSVSPAEGSVPGTDIMVSYIGREYSARAASGVLTVQTDADQWTFLVRGGPPRYSAPSKADLTSEFTLLRMEAAKQPAATKTATNYVVSNMKAATTTKR